MLFLIVKKLAKGPFTNDVSSEGRGGISEKLGKMTEDDKGGGWGGGGGHFGPNFS